MVPYWLSRRKEVRENEVPAPSSSQHLNRLLFTAMRMAAVAFDLGEILIDCLLAVVAAIVRIRPCSTYAHLVLTLFACHVLPPSVLIELGL